VGKKKDNSSLTSKERKEIRQREKEKQLKKEKKHAHVLGYEAREKTQIIETPEVDEFSEGEVLTKKKLPPVKLLMYIGVPALVLIILLFSILLPVTIIPHCAMIQVGNPVARMHLSNGMVLDFEIFEDEVPAPATNFIFLARMGYFDDAIIFDIQSGFARFGGFRNNAFFHREQDLEFTSTVSGLEVGSDWVVGRSIFSYRFSGNGRFTTNNGIEGRYRESGWLSFLPNSATEFQMALRQEADSWVQNDNGAARQNMTGRAFGEALNQETRDNLAILSRIADYGENGGVMTVPGINHWWLPRQTITITRISFFNLNRSRWTPDPNGTIQNNPQKWNARFNFSEWKRYHNVNFWSTGTGPPR